MCYQWNDISARRYLIRVLMVIKCNCYHHQQFIIEGISHPIHTSCFIADDIRTVAVAEWVHDIHCHLCILRFYAIYQSDAEIWIFKRWGPHKLFALRSKKYAKRKKVIAKDEKDMKFFNFLRFDFWFSHSWVLCPAITSCVSLRFQRTLRIGNCRESFRWRNIHLQLNNQRILLYPTSSSLPTVYRLQNFDSSSL